MPPHVEAEDAVLDHYPGKALKYETEIKAGNFALMVSEAEEKVKQILNNVDRVIPEPAID